MNDLAHPASLLATVPQTASRTGAQVLLDTLVALGVDTVFGYPGGAVLPIYDALHAERRIRHVLVRHEQAAVHAAEGYARTTGKPGVVLVTSGPGVSNTITGLLDAMCDSIPVICISGQVATLEWSSTTLGREAVPTGCLSCADVVQLALWLAMQAGQTDLLDDVERLLRARILPSQIIDPSQPRQHGGWGAYAHGFGRGCILDVFAAVLSVLTEVQRAVVTRAADGMVSVNLHFSTETPLPASPTPSAPNLQAELLDDRPEDLVHQHHLGDGGARLRESRGVFTTDDVSSEPDLAPLAEPPACPLPRKSQDLPVPRAVGPAFPSHQCRVGRRSHRHGCARYPPHPLRTGAPYQDHATDYGCARCP